MGILDKATLTLGDNRRVDFSRCMIFLTSNLGAKEMANLLHPRLGFAAGAAETSSRLRKKVSGAGREAARRKFTPEFMNRIDKVVVFHALGEAELDKILDLELGYVQQRILQSPSAEPFLFQCTARAKAFLLEAGSDLQYGARHLKRAIERLLVQALSNLMVTRQVRAGDMIRIDWNEESRSLMFSKVGEGLPFSALMGRAECDVAVAETASAAAGAGISPQRHKGHKEERRMVIPG